MAPMDAPLVALGDIVREDWPKDFTQRPGNIFSYVVNNYYFTNWPAEQGGHFTFRYVLISGRDLAPEALGQFARAEMAPLVTDEIISNDKAIFSQAPLSADQASFIDIDQPNIAIVGWRKRKTVGGWCCASSKWPVSQAQ